MAGKNPKEKAAGLGSMAADKETNCGLHLNPKNQFFAAHATAALLPRVPKELFPLMLRIVLYQIKAAFGTMEH